MVSDMFFPTVTDPREFAQGAIRDYCGWHVAPVETETLTVDGNGRSLLLLPSGRIRKLLKVVVCGEDVTDRVRASARAGMIEGVKFPHRFGAVEVTLEHGYSPHEVPSVIGVLDRATKRFATDPRIRSQAVAGASVGYATTAGGAPLSHLLTVDEKQALDTYRIYWGV